jgi:hypothetical protein
MVVGLKVLKLMVAVLFLDLMSEELPARVDMNP